MLKDPDAAARPMLFWVWNGDMTRERIDAMLELFAEQGAGGVFVHPRTGLITEYLSDEWFDLWGYALERCEALGLQCHIYDENSYPSGFAGGHVVSSNPHLAGTHLCRRVVFNPVDYNDRAGPVLLAAARVDGEGRFVEFAGLEELGSVTPARSLEIYEIVDNPNSLWSAGYPQVDLLRPETTRAFLAVTHERYAKRFAGQMGKTIRWAFADEPQVSTGGLPMSYFLLREFRQEHGYGLESKLPHLYHTIGDGEESRRVRFDYWRTVNRLFTTNYVKACHDWCEAHGIGFTGHFHESSWPEPKNQPSTMAALRWMQAPGNDLLAFQFSTRSMGENGIYALSLRELNSIKRQCGRSTSLVESTGGGGYGFTLRDFKPIEDYLLVNGVNLINPHLGHQSLAGARKYDWAHTISDHSPWIHRYRLQADHVARTNAICNQGTEHNRVLLLHPDTTSWLHWTGMDEPKSEVSPCAEIRRRHGALILELARHGIDFDLGDEFTIEEMGRIEKTGTIPRFRIGDIAYDVVWIPAWMESILPATWKLLQQFISEGGRVVCFGEGLTHLGGTREPSIRDRLNELAGQKAATCRQCDTTSDALAVVKTWVPPRIRTGNGEGSLPGNLCWRRTEMPGGEVWLLVNPCDESLEFSGQLDGNGEPWLQIDTICGKVSGVHEPGQALSIELCPRGHALLVSAGLMPEVNPQAIASPPRKLVASAGEPELQVIVPHALNMLVIDYCDLHVDDEWHENMNTIHADRLNWRRQGFRQNIWSFSIQFRRSFIDTERRPGSGFRVRYRFQMDVDASAIGRLRNSLQLALERPWLYQIRLNGEQLDYIDAERWFDEDMRILSIGNQVKQGENILELGCSPFHPLAEIMPVYVLGDFSLRAIDKGFAIKAPQPLELGDLGEQGRPFDPMGAVYRYNFFLDEAVASLEMRLPQWEGSVAELRLDDGEPRSLVFIGDRAVWNRPVPAGPHRLEIDLRGNLKNQLGPFFSNGLSGPWSWMASPQKQPSGAGYRFYPAGLLANPEVRV